MIYDNRKIAGLLLVVGGVLCILGIIIAEALYPGYSTSENYISDLGVGPSALIFNSSIFLLGVLTISCAYFIHKAFNSIPFSMMLAITGIGAMGVGLFTEDAGVLHTVFSLITFLFGGMLVIVSYKFQKPPLSYVSVVLGFVSLVALVLFASGTNLGLGKGGMERLIAYPVLLGAVSFGGHLIGDSKGTSAT
jgi:hypothetical membrane protein